MKNLFVFIRKIIPEKNCSFVFIILLLCLPSYTAAKEEVSEKLKKDYFLSQSLKLGKKPVQSAVFSPNDQQAVILSGSSSLEIFRIQNGKRQRVISSHDHKAISLALHDGGKLVVTGGQDETVRIWSPDQSNGAGSYAGTSQRCFRSCS